MRNTKLLHWNYLNIVLCLLMLTAPLSAYSQSPKQNDHLLVDQHGAPFKFDDLIGKPSVVHFGFTNCPVICPTMLNGVAVYMQKLGKRANEINFVFVSVDPERDTPDTLKQYISYFDSRVIGVTGSAKGIARLAGKFGTKYEKRRSTGGSYEMAHVIFAYLLDENGHESGTLYMGAESNPKVVMRRLSALIE